VHVYVETVPTVETKAAVQLPAPPVTVKVGRPVGASALAGTVIVPVNTRMAFGNAEEVLGVTARVGVALATVVELEDAVAATRL